MPTMKHSLDQEKNLQPTSKRRRTHDFPVIDLTTDSDCLEDTADSQIVDLTKDDVGSSATIDEDGGEDEEMRDILAQIAAQEQSEKLARELEAQEGVGTSKSHGNVPIHFESDEDLARRLAAEWEKEDGTTVIQASSEPEKTRARSIPRVHENGGDNESEVPPNNLLDPLFTSERPCSKCGNPVSSPRGFVVLKGDGLIPPSLSYLLHAPCKSCKTNHCRGCFKPVPCTLSCKGKPTAKSQNSTNTACIVHSCCAEGRAIAIFELLGGFDWKYLGEQEMSATRAEKAASRKTKSSHSSVGPGGTGYSSGRSGGGYRSWGANTQKTSEKRSKSEMLSEHWDEIICRALRLLVDLLPRQYAEDAEVFDMLPHPSIGNLIRLSCVPEYLVSLLRNDSVSDWVKRKDIYYAMLALLRRLSECELTVQVLVKPRWEQQKLYGITKLMWHEEELVWRRTTEEDIELAPPLFDYFQKLTKQCESFLASASQAQLFDGGDDASEEDIISATSLCGDMIVVRDDILRAMEILGITSAGGENGTGKGKGKNVDPRHAVEEKYRLACERLGFKHVELATFAGGDGRLQNIYSYAGELSQSQTMTRVPKDRFHLIKELATMATSLPEGIFVRVDETRNDAIKAMIAGPPSTPYAGGLFEFDIYLPMTYPNTPPLVKLRTTGGGSVRFNPNLYNCGKVCLSLLGTWSGSADEQWKPGKSTLLQVLVSIQSMIFVEGPYFNEPGYGSVDLKKPASISYNKNIEAQTSRWAIVDWLRDEHNNGLWTEIISAHFLIRKDEIREQLRNWASSNTCIKSYTSSSPGSAPVWIGGGGVGSSFMPPAAHSSLNLGFGDASDWSSNWDGVIASKGNHKSSGNTKVMDLIKEFEEGIKVVEQWGL